MKIDSYCRTQVCKKKSTPACYEIQDDEIWLYSINNSYICLRGPTFAIKLDIRRLCILEAMNRRKFISRGLALAGVPALAYLQGRSWAQSAALSQGSQFGQLMDLRGVLPSPSMRSLVPVDVDDRKVIRTTVGLRPYRPSGFVVRTEQVDETLVVHNYGHGGAGLTLSWGTAELALQMGCPGHTGPVAVLGSGAVGLATARLLQECGYKVTIYTKGLPPETTSFVAGGEWFPFLVADPEKSNARFNQQLMLAAEFAYKRYLNLVGDHFGIRWVRSYSISKDGFDENGPIGIRSPFRGMMPEFCDLRTDEHPFPAASSVRQYDTLLIEPPRYLPAMMNAFRDASGSVVVREIVDRRAVAQLPERLVFNCTGIGAKDVFGDDELTPVRGQVTYLKPQPMIDYALSHDQLYMLPRTDGILLGGTYELGMTSLTPDMDKKRRILARHKAFFDSYRRTS
ncbi:MAG TPA: FAD-dependent oxidoreductase [Acidobacteriaceae bacterium]|jgi:glycine/D-amino acid oxidase-like deaminating enzyme